MSKVVLMCGISGSGKTTCAQRLVEKGFTKLSVDESIWNRFGFSTYELMSAEEKMNAIALVESTIIDEMVDLIKYNNDIIIDSTMCKRAKRERFKKIAESYGANVSLWYISTDKETLIKRLQQRGQNIGPNSFPVSLTDLEKFWKGFEHPSDDELSSYAHFDYTKYL